LFVQYEFLEDQPRSLIDSHEEPRTASEMATPPITVTRKLYQ